MITEETEKVLSLQREKMEMVAKDLTSECPTQTEGTPEALKQWDEAFQTNQGMHLLIHQEIGRQKMAQTDLDDLKAALASQKESVRSTQKLEESLETSTKEKLEQFCKLKAQLTALKHSISDSGGSSEPSQRPCAVTPDLLTPFFGFQVIQQNLRVSQLKHEITLKKQNLTDLKSLITQL